jgi:CheY-like chemotaxis protein
MCKVLMIDDNPVEHLIVQRISERDHLFERLDCEDDAGKVLEVLQASEEEITHLPDIILLDLQMPNVSGWDFLKRLNCFYNSMKKKIDVYILSSSVSETDRRVSLSYPFVKGFFSKPMTTSLLHQLRGDHMC